MVQSNTPFFTVFTPTYNRAHLLGRVYQSLCRQTDQDFEWIVVNDGSTDDTATIVGKWVEEAPFPIRYYYQPNSGKHIAINRGLSMANGFLFVIVDSDDWLVPHALESIRRVWSTIPGDEQANFAGVVGLYSYPSGQVVGTGLCSAVLDSNAVEIRTKHKVKGDLFGANRVDVLKKYLFPENLGRFVPESLVWNRIAQRYQLRFVNEVWAYTEYQPDGLSARSIHVRSRSPHAARLYYKEFSEITNLYIPVVERYKAHANYVRFSLHGRIPIPRHFAEAPSKVLWVLAIPTGFALYYRDLWVMRHEKC